MKQYTIVIHATDFVRGGGQPIGTDGEVVYTMANSATTARLRAENMMAALGDGREYDVFEPKTATLCGTDITPKSDALIFDPVDTPTEPGKYAYKELSEDYNPPHGIEELEVFLNGGKLFVVDTNEVVNPIGVFNGQWYKERGNNE